MSKQTKIPVAIIGKNFGYKVLSKALTKSKKFDLKAISFKSKKFEKVTDRRIFFSSNWKAVIKTNKVKAVIIATPPDTHEEIINYAIKHGKHIFCEKPCSLSFEKVKKILRKIENKKKFISHMVNFELIEIDAFKYFRNHIKKNKTKIHSINVEWNIFDRSQLTSWKNFHSKGGGLIFNYLCHSLYYLEKIFGKITYINCLTEFKLNKKNKSIEVLLRIKRDIFCTISINSNKNLGKKQLFHKLFIATNEGNFQLKSKTINISDRFNLEKFFLIKGKLIKKKIFYEKRNSQDFRISPSCYNFKKFAASIERKKIANPSFIDAKNIHLLIKKIVQSSKKK